MIHTLIFDIGNVLADFNWRGYLAGWKLPKEEHEIVEQALFMSPMWKEVDRGACPDEELLNLICKKAPGYEELIRRIYAGAGVAVQEYAYAPGMLKQLKEMGYGVYILSNYGKAFYEERKPYFHFLEYTDGQVISYQEKQVKPEPEIYETLLSRYQICPEESVFFDDLRANLEAAEEFGIHTVQVTGYESILEGLGRFGIRLEL
ncbi:MAG: HAD family phosphatase [Lachnospiraceae bacterium]|jgi:putative hydrolase of the HAD superfamily|nr:HAD family phosphatase [Lachnospiraceae bacterium]